MLPDTIEELTATGHLLDRFGSSAPWLFAAGLFLAALGAVCYAAARKNHDPRAARQAAGLACLGIASGVWALSILALLLRLFWRPPATAYGDDGITAGYWWVVALATLLGLGVVGLLCWLGWYLLSVANELLKTRAAERYRFNNLGLANSGNERKLPR